MLIRPRIKIPFADFVLTNAGEVSQHQITMFRERVRTVGVSLLGGNSGVEGPYELGIDSIRAVNDEDVPAEAIPGTYMFSIFSCAQYADLTR